MARNKNRQKPEILRAIRLQNGDTVNPGDEDQLEELIEDDIAQADANLAAEGKEKSGRTVGQVMRRLARKGYVIGFGHDEDDEDDTQHPNADLRANARHARAASVQKVVSGPAPRGLRGNRAKAKAAPVMDDPGDGLGSNEQDDEIESET